MRKLWGGAFDAETDGMVEDFSGSFADDLRFWRQDVQGSIAHARMLGETGILTRDDAATLVRGLEQILSESVDRLPHDVEDIHTAVEVRLRELVGEVAGRLHTARSRNDQVATDARLALRDRIDELMPLIKAFQAELLAQAGRSKAWLLPGYTHQQPAQPLTLGYHLLAYFWALQRHGWRLERLREVVNLSPLGAAALAGTNFPIDRRSTARELGFAAPIPNALDATSDRSFVLDALHWANSLMIDLSRFAQELVLWSTAEFGFVRLDDGVTTGSSIMPQKRNPDMAELIRGRAGRTLGHYTALAATMKALPLGYNRDTQDDKPGLFASLDCVTLSLRLSARMLAGATWNRSRMAAAAEAGYSWATDLANALAASGMPFRAAHEVVGELVRALDARGGTLGEWVYQEFLTQHLSPGGVDSVRGLLNAHASVKARESEGAPGPNALRQQLAHARRLHRKPSFRTLL